MVNVYNYFYNLHLHNICRFEMYWAKQGETPVQRWSDCRSAFPRCGDVSGSCITASHSSASWCPGFSGSRTKRCHFCCIISPVTSFINYSSLVSKLIPTIIFCLMFLTRNIFMIGTFKLAKILHSKYFKIWIKYLYLWLHYMKKIIIPTLMF